MSLNICRGNVKYDKFVVIRCLFSSSKYSKTRFWPGLCPGPHWGAYDVPPNPLVSWGGGLWSSMHTSFSIGVARNVCWGGLTTEAPRSRHRRHWGGREWGGVSRSRRLSCQAPNTHSWLRLCWKMCAWMITQCISAMRWQKYLILRWQSYLIPCSSILSSHQCTWNSNSITNNLETTRLYKWEMHSLQAAPSMLWHC